MRAARTLVAVTAVSLLGGCAWIDRSSVSSRPDPVEGNGPSGGPSVSQSGRWVVFTSDASNLVPGDVNGDADVFVHDHVTGVTELISVATGGWQSDEASGDGTISDDGRYVAFASTTGLFDNPPQRFTQNRIFVRDRTLRTTTRVDFPTADLELITPGLPAISGNGKFVAYVGGDPQFPHFRDPRLGPFVRDLVNGTTKRMPSGGGIDSSALFESVRPSLSDDGSRITYSFIVPPPPEQSPAMSPFSTVVADTRTATVIAILHSGTIDTASRFESAISGDGTKVAYVLAEGGQAALYLYDLQNPCLVPLITNIPGPSSPALSDDGTVIGFSRRAGDRDEYVVTTSKGSAPVVVSADVLGRPASSLLGANLSGDGVWVAFASSDPALVRDDTNGAADVFVRSTRPGRGPPS